MGTAFRRGVQSLCLIVGATWLAQACSVDYRPPPPRRVPLPTGVSAGAASTTPQGWDNLCECIAAISDREGVREICLKCLDLAEPQCQMAATACDVDPGCTYIKHVCFPQCGYDPECIDRCALPFDLDAGHQEYADMMTCGCAQCPECAYPEPLRCDGTDGAGGD